MFLVLSCFLPLPLLTKKSACFIMSSFTIKACGFEDSYVLPHASLVIVSLNCYPVIFCLFLFFPNKISWCTEWDSRGEWHQVQMPSIQERDEWCCVDKTSSENTQNQVLLSRLQRHAQTKTPGVSLYFSIYYYFYFF